MLPVPKAWRILRQGSLEILLPDRLMPPFIWQDIQNEGENMDVEKDRKWEVGFGRVRLVVSPVMGLIAAILVAVYRITPGSGIAALLLTFCVVTLATSLVMRAIGWVVRRSVNMSADKTMNDKGRQ